MNRAIKELIAQVSIHVRPYHNTVVDTMSYQDNLQFISCNLTDNDIYPDTEEQ